MKRLYRLMGSVLAVVLLSGCSDIEGSEGLMYGVVQEKVFTGGETSVHVGAGVPIGGSRGGGSSVMPMVMVGGTSDEYIVFINNEKYTTTKEMWLSIQNGDEIIYKNSYGRLKDFIVLSEDREDFTLQEGLVKELTGREDVTFMGRFNDNEYVVNIGDRVYTIKVWETESGYTVGHGDWEQTIKE